MTDHPTVVEERFRLFVESVVDYGIFMLDPGGHVMTWNAGAQRIKGYRPDEIIGQHFSRFYPQEDIDAGKPPHELEVAAAVGRFEDEGWRLRKDGTRFWANVVITALRDESGQLYGFGKVTRDLTERKQSEERLKALNAALEQRTQELTDANADLESFSYSVAHDLRTPLRQIAGFSQILMEDFGSKLEPEAQRYVDKLRAGARYMGRLVDDLLNLSRIGRQALRTRPTSLDALVEEARDNTSADVDGREVEWRVGALPRVDCDAGLMQQVFMNLIGNALKYTRRQPHAIIEIGYQLDPAAVYVRDNGVGFDMQYADKLFGVFQRLHRSSEFEGTGVGLAIVQRIIRKHGGQLWAHAEPDRGATFYFTLPGLKAAA
jgi:PAS domain S-box-containing protein